MIRKFAIATSLAALLAGGAIAQEVPHFRMGLYPSGGGGGDVAPPGPPPSIAFNNVPVTNEPILLGAPPATPYTIDFRNLVTVEGGSVNDATWSIIVPGSGTAFYDTFSTSTGVLTGIAPGGEYDFTVVATIPSGTSTSQPFVLSVNDPGIVFQGSEGPATPLVVSASAGQPYTFDFNTYLGTSGGVQTSNVNWSISPSGGTGFFTNFATSGVLTGTAGVGTYQFTLTAQDTVTGVSRQQLFTLSVTGVPLMVSNIVRSDWHGCGINSSGGAMCWGTNVGSLYLGATGQTNHATAVPIASLSSGVVSLSGGLGLLCALTSSNVLSCWGQGTNGKLGDGTTTNRGTPAPVLVPEPVVAFDTGQEHGCAVGATTGGVWCWGVNTEGQVSGSSGNTRPNPIPVAGLPEGRRAVSVAAGTNFSCALMDDATAWCWGSNAAGQLGADRTTGTSQRSVTPVQVVNVPEGIVAISAYNQHACIRTSAGAAKCWGWNNNGQIGDGSITNRNVPTQVIGLGAGIARISAGGQHSCVVTTAGEARCWGGASGGALGNGVLASSSARRPITVTGLQNGVTWIQAGLNGTCATLSDGTSRCWGQAPNGDGTASNRGTPVLVIQ